MNENLDLTKILKGCPKGTAFYSPLCGELRFEEIYIGDEYPVILFSPNTALPVEFTQEGYFLNEYKNHGAECILFPSKDQRDWSKFERFWDKPKVEKFDPKTLKPFDKVLVRDYLNEDWMGDFFEKILEHDIDYNVACVTCKWTQCIPYNDETKHLLGTNDDCPDYYKWWEE